jgi:hypothetical protein
MSRSKPINPVRTPAYMIVLPSSTGLRLLSASFTKSLKPNLSTAVTTHNNTKNSCIILHTQNTNAIQRNVFLTGTHRLWVTNKGNGNTEELYSRSLRFEFRLGHRPSRGGVLVFFRFSRQKPEEHIDKTRPISS